MSNYETYKDSGAEWLGELPSNWKTGVIGSLYTLRNTKVSDADYPPLSVTMRGIVPQLENAAKTDDHDARKLVLKGDFAINSRSDRRGSCGVSDYDGSVSLINTVLTPRDSMNPQYYNWLFHTVQFADEFYKQGRGIVDDLWTTRWNEMKRILIPVPTDEEQAAIAEYLAKNVTRIDAIIAEAKASIEEYKEWKASIIYEAVTKGLDPNVEMKNSGIERIGEIPKNWSVFTLGSLSESIRNGYVGPTKDLFYEEGIRYIQSLHVKDGKINFAKHEYYVSKAWGEKHPKVCTGDLVIVQTGDIGQVGLVTPDYDGCNCHALIIVSPRRDVVYPKFEMYYFLNPIGKELLLKTKTGATLPHLNSGKIKSTAVCLPPYGEQIEIAEYLDEKCVRIDSLITEKEALIADLEAYKKSLVFEVVTGKRKVV